MLQFLNDSQSFIDTLKRAAKKEKKAVGERNHSFYLDKIALVSGYQSWALLHKKLSGLLMFDEEYVQINQTINKHISKALPHAAQDYITNELRKYLKTYCLNRADFTYFNPADHEIADLREQLLEEYCETYPKIFIQNAIIALEKEGPWVIDNTEPIFEYDILDSGN